MTERDNFNLAKFLRNNQLLNESFEGFGGYRDLSPLKEDDTNNEAAYFAEAVGDLYYVDLDSANFDDKLFQADLRANKIKTKIIDPEGPAGYAPVVRYMASKQTLADMITKHWATDPETAREWFKEIQPMNEVEDLGGWDDGEDPQYDGEYDGEFGPEIVNEVSQKDFNDGMEKVIAHIKDGSGKIDRGYVEKTWEEVTGIDFDWVKDEVMDGLKNAGVLNLNYESKLDEVTYVTDDSEDEKGFVVPGSFHIEDFDDTDLNGSAVEMAIDDLISEFDRIIKKAVPQDLQYSARIFVKKLWASKLKDWKSNMQ